MKGKGGPLLCASIVLVVSVVACCTDIYNTGVKVGETSSDSTPAPPTPYEFLNITAKGNVVTDNFTVQRCKKAVFSWTIAEGGGPIMVELWPVDDSTETGYDWIGGYATVIYSNDLKGEELQPLKGGAYYLDVTAWEDKEWTVVGECRD